MPLDDLDINNDISMNNGSIIHLLLLESQIFRLTIPNMDYHTFYFDIINILVEYNGSNFNRIFRIISVSKPLVLDRDIELKK